MDVSDLSEDEARVLQSLKEKYKVHDVVFSRSVGKATSVTDLFDILHTMPGELPLIWDKDERRWCLVREIVSDGKKD